MKTERNFGRFVELNKKEKYILFAKNTPAEAQQYYFKSTLFENVWGVTSNRSRVKPMIKSLHAVKLQEYCHERDGRLNYRKDVFDLEFLMEETEVRVLAELAWAYERLHDVVVQLRER